jgi:hypothetical protein
MAKIFKKLIKASGGDDTFPADKYFEGGYAEVVLPNATKIKSYAFCEDSKLETIHMPNVTEINSNAFKNCTKLVLTSMPEKLTRLSISAFYGCTGLKSIYLPKNLEVISYSAFQWCTNLNTVTFKGTPTSITSDAFKNCTNLKIINVPWAEGVVANAPWGTNATINYNYGQAPSLISFTVNGKSYQTKEGTTWSEFCGGATEATEATPIWVVSNVVFCSLDKNGIYTGSGLPIEGATPSSVIVAGTDYKTKEYPGGGSN